ncbi:AfsR/SARP family transcriptional regulator [Actinomadura parmotrematis]|uniref:Bacterial transcriptional activator domain-containing protein n=1 Tax=Actinomadura parmotrematis TaxID=2864039 RepID=A0ABS7G225_9ACTN|nr:bacterial transcriptional activator domain-containing protein [Actinomadura parmotrematis]MBW8485934.1 bacterial transcriptional activator domain-containing protein [Actinomadura parmotrematis]
MNAEDGAPPVTPVPGEIAFTLLGRVGGRLGDRVIEPDEPRARLILAILLWHAERPVQRDYLRQNVWTSVLGEAGKLEDNKKIGDHIGRIRNELAKVDPEAGKLLPRASQGVYRINAPARQIDLLRSRALGRHASSLRGKDDAGAVYYYRRALDQWGELPDGPWTAELLGGLMPLPWVENKRAQLIGEYEELLFPCVELELGLRPIGEVLSGLRGLAAGTDRPKDRLIGLLMRALYLAGERAEALEVFERHGERNSGRPGAESTRIARRIRDDDPALLPQSFPPPDGTIPLGAGMSENESAEEPRNGRDSAQEAEEIGEAAVAVIVETARCRLGNDYYLPGPAARALMEAVESGLRNSSEAAMALAAVQRDPERGAAALHTVLVARMLADAGFMATLREHTERLADETSSRHGRGVVINSRKIDNVVTIQAKRVGTLNFGVSDS